MGKKRIVVPRYSGKYQDQGYQGFTGSNFFEHLESQHDPIRQNMQKSQALLDSNEELRNNLQEASDEIDRQEAENQAHIDALNKKAEEEELAPANAIEAEAKATFEPEKYKGLKDITAKIQELEDLNVPGKRERDYKTATEDTSILEYPLDYLKEAVIGKAYGAAEFVSHNSSYMTPKQLQELEQLRAKKQTIIRPIVEARLKRNHELVDRIDKEAERWGTFGVGYEARNLQTANNLAWTERDELESALEDKNNIFNGFFGHTGNKIKSLLSVGIIPAIDQFKVANIMEKQRAGELLTPTEQTILDAGAYKQDTQKSLGEKGFYSQLGEGLETSVELGASMSLSGLATKGAKAAALEALNVGAANSFRNLAIKGAINTVDLGAKVAMSPFTYNTYAQKFTSPMVVTQDANGKEVVLTSKEQKKTFENDSANATAVKTQELNALQKKGEGKSKRAAEIQEELNQIFDSVNRIYEVDEKGNSTGEIGEDVTKWNAAVYAGTESAKEIFSEMFVGHAAGRIGHTAKMKAVGTKLEAFINGVGKILDKVPSIATTKVGKITSALGYHTNFNEVFQSVPEEFMEEIFTGAVPTYNAEKGEYNMKDYYKQLEQFKDPNFYAQIAASTFLMGGIPATLAAAQHKYNYSKSSDYKAAYDAQKKSMEDLGDFYNKLDKNITDKDLANSITMRAGNTLYSVPEYEGKVADLRNKGKETEAKRLESMAFQNLAAQALRTDSLDQFELAMKRMSKNGGLHADTVANVQEALATTIPAMRDVEFRYSERPNYEDIQKLATNDQIHNLDRRQYKEAIAQTQKEINDKVDKLREQGHVPASFDVNAHMLNKELEATPYVTEAGPIEKIPSIVSSVVGEDIDRLVELEAGLAITNEHALKNAENLAYQTNRKNLPAIKAEIKKAKEEAIDAQPQSVRTVEDADKLVRDLVEATNGETVKITLVDGTLIVEITNNVTGEVRTEQVTPTISGLAEKKNQLETQDIIAEAVPGFTPNNVIMSEVNVPEVVEGSKEMTPEAQGMVSIGGFNFSQGGSQGDFDEQAFSPREIDRNISEAKKQQMIGTTNTYADFLERELGKVPTFDDVVKDLIERSSMKKVDEAFEVYKLCWELSGRDVSNAQDVYNKYLSARENFLSISGMFFDETEFVEDTTNTVVPAIVEASKTATFDINNQPVVKDGTNTSKSKTSVATPKAAFLGMEYTTVQTENGEVNVPVLAQLNESTTIDNHLVLDPVFTKVGLKLEVNVPEDVDSHPVSQWSLNDENVLVRETMSFGDWQKRNNVEKGSLRYNNKVPMVASVEGKGIFLIHDTDWYNTKNMSGLDAQDQMANIKSGKLQTQNMRGQILAGNNTIEIEERKFGQVFRINTLKDNNQPLVLSEATGDTNLAVATGVSNLRAGRTDQTNLKLVNQKDFNPGQLYEVRKVNTGEHIALPVLTNNVANGEMINDTAYYNTKFAILAGIALNHATREDVQQALGARSMDLVKARAIQKAILESTGIDIEHAIQNYINLFTRVDFKNDQFISNLESTETKSSGSLKYPTGVNYITVEASGIIKIANKDGNPVPRNPKNPKYDALQGFSYKSISDKAVGMAFKIFDENFGGASGNFRKSSFNASVEHLGKVIPFHKITETGSVLEYNNAKGTGNTYDDFIKDNVKSNIKSFPIKDAEGNTKWITDIQPMVYYKSAGAQVEVERPIEAKANIEAQKADIEKRRQEELDNSSSKFNKTVYHGSKSKIEGEFKIGEGLETIHFTEDKSLAESYGKNINEAIIDTKNPLIINGKKTDAEFDEILDKYTTITKEEANGHDSIIINIELDNGKTYNEVIVFDKSQVKFTDKINAKYDAELEALGQSTTNPAKLAAEATAEELGAPVQEVTVVEATVPVQEKVSIQQAIEALPADLKARMSEFRIEDFSDDAAFSRRELGAAEVAAIEGLKNNQMVGLTVLQQKQLVNSMFNEVLASISLKKGTINVQDILDKVKNAPSDLLQPEIDRLKAFVSQIEASGVSAQPLVDNLNNQAKRLESVLRQQDKLTSTEVGNKGDLVRKIQAFLSEDITEESTLEDINDTGEVDNNYSKDATEIDVKLSFSSELKVFFAGVMKKDPISNKTSRNFSYLPDYESVDTVIQSLTEVMVGLASDKQSLLDILETKQFLPIYGDVLRKVRTAPVDIQNQLLYKMIQSKLDMYMITVSQKEGAFSLKVINPNSSASEVKMKLEWNANFSNSSLMKSVQDQRVYDKAAMEKLLADIEGLSSIPQLSSANLDTVKPVMEKIGVRISDNTLARVLDEQKNGLYKDKTGILYLFKTKIRNALNNNKNSEVSLEEYNPYSDAKGVINSLIQKEIELNGTKVAKSFRTAGKSIQGAIQKMMVYEIKEGLKDPTSQLFQDLKQIPYSANNYILNFLGLEGEVGDKFRKNFDIGFVSLQAIKKMKQKDSGDKKVNKLTTTDHMLTQYAFFQNTQREIGQELPGSRLQFRMGQMFNPSLSDKEQMILYTTALVDTDYSNYTVNGSTVVLGDEVNDFVTDQIFGSEFDRIISTFNNPTNIKNYDGAAKRFLSIPKLNDMTFKGKDIFTAMQEAAHSPEAVAAIKAEILEQARGIVKETIEANVKSKANVAEGKGTWYEAGFLTKAGQETQIKYFDGQYLARKRGQNTKLSNDALAQIAAYDFVVNQFLNQHMTYQLVAGDMALYAPSVGKATNKSTKRVDFLKLVKMTGESITKRMAMLIAPGSKLANSKNDKYLQIFLNDSVKMTNTARELIKQYYGSVSEAKERSLQTLENLEDILEQLYKGASTSEATKRAIETVKNDMDSVLKELASSNPEISGYFSIEGTDAQEYTTWKEHVDVLFRQGRLTEKDQAILQSAYKKLEKGEDLNQEELSVVMNPIKPVYSGNNTFNKDGKPNVNRIVYIKSSSFPLLPQLTRDFKLDKVRQHMEDLQSLHGKNVRLSYQTANKVGAIDTKLTVDDLYHSTFDEVMKGNLGDSYLELDRDNFRIQQDTPYKTAKNLKAGKDDSTTMGSQMWKIILGNGINKITEKVFPNIFDTALIAHINTLVGDKPIIPSNGMVSGKDLDQIKFHAEKMYFDIQKQALMEELGIGENGLPIDRSETIKKVHELLLKETASGQYPEAVMDNLGLVKDQAEAEFLLPIWLSNSSNKFESLLQSIITTRLIKIKLPGNQHISASSEGFARVTNLEEIDTKVKSGVVWVDPNHTGDLKATTVDGKLKEAEVLIQSKFRVTKDGKTKLVDLTKAPYSSLVDGRLVLNKEMIEDALLSNFSFRIPTSSHQSGAILKVVGFLPEASGDMLVVPKEQTVQLGEDYDVDKRTLYKSNYVVGKDGKITKQLYDEKARSKDKAKVLENAMIDIYKAVYQSPSVEVQKKINKILSFDVASDTANLINNKVNSSKDESNFTTYSDEYQREQMKLGADGKTGIGGHSNAVTAQAQMERLEHPLRLSKKEPVKAFKTNSAGELIGQGRTVFMSDPIPSRLTIGDLTSDGVLGKVKTLDGSRSIGDVHTENQNSSTDNIKAQIMGKRNENPYTMNVLIQLTFRGFDQAKLTIPNSDKLTEVQVPSLFIAQPILRRYVELQEQAKSLTSDFSANKEKDILNKLIEEFNTDSHKISRDNEGNVDPIKFLDDKLYASASKKMTGDALYTNLVKESAESDIQLAVLQKFFEIDREAKLLTKYTGMLNLSTSGLGISYFNVLDRIQTLNEMGEEDNIENIRDLVGDFIHKDQFVDYETGLPPVDKRGYTLIGDYFIKPTTTEGTMLIQALSSAESIMDPLFPYKQSIIDESIENVLALKGDKLGKAKKLELRYQIKDALKDFMYSIPSLGIFQGDINKERQRLFFDTPTNTSLAKYLKETVESGKHPLLENNELIKNLGFDGISIIGAPSIIKHISSTNTNFDRTDEYNAYLELLQDDKTIIGEFNGEVMTPRKLAQDLASYAYLANNESGAVGFRDFINVKYLEAIGVSKNMRDVTKDLGLLRQQISNFITQFFQHNPQEARPISKKSKLTTFKLTNPEAKIEEPHLFFQNLEEFALDGVTDAYVSIEDNSIEKSTKGYRLYQRVGNRYVRIPVLGSFGYNEYNPDSINQKSLMYPGVGRDITQEQPLSKQITGVNIEEALDTSDGVVSVLEQFNESPNAKYKEFAKKLAPFIDNGTKIVIEDKVINGNVLNTGVYLKSDNTIYLSPSIVDKLTQAHPENTMDILEEVVMEEIVHSITIAQLDKFGTKTGSTYTPNEDAPSSITRLAKLFNVAQAALPYNETTGENYYTKDIYEFVAGAFVSDSFKESLDNATHNGKSMFEHFKDIIASLLRTVTGSTYSDEVINSVYELLDYTKAEHIESSSKNPIETLKKGDDKLEEELSKLEPKVDITNLKAASNYSEDNAKRLIGMLDNGSTFTITPTKVRVKGSAEYLYMQDVLAHLGTLAKQQGVLPTDLVDIKTIDENTQTVKMKPKAVAPVTTSIGGFNFSSGGPDNYSAQEFRLPEIKKCK